jgi:K+-sensing histidine kinase KdpD
VKESGRKNSDKIFVYKIIHDLKHPTQALCDGLEKIVHETDQLKRKKNKHFTANLRYKSHPKIKRVIKDLLAFAK